MKRTMIVLLSATTLVLSGCASHSVIGNSAPPTTQSRTAKKQVATTWHVGQFTISTHLLPRLYDPHVSWNYDMALTRSALYYVPKSTPTELLVESLPSGHTHVVTKLDCENVQSQTMVGTVNSSYLLVNCEPPNGKLQQGILVDITTGAKWTLWTHGYGNSDGTYFWRVWVYGGWAYYEAYTVGWGQGLVQRAMNLATGTAKSAPYPFGQYLAAYRAPDGTLYGMKWSGSSSVDLYRLNGPYKSTLVAEKLPVDGGNGISSMLTIDANGTIWVPRPGGTLTPSAGAMTIRVVKPTPAPPKSKVLTDGIGYVVSLGTAPPAYGGSPVQVTVATSDGTTTVVVGRTPTLPEDYGVMPYGVSVPFSEVVFFPASNGRWQIVTVSRDNSP